MIKNSSLHSLLHFKGKQEFIQKFKIGNPNLLLHFTRGQVMGTLSYIEHYPHLVEHRFKFSSICNFLISSTPSTVLSTPPFQHLVWQLFWSDKMKSNYVALFLSRRKGTYRWVGSYSVLNKCLTLPSTT